MARPENIEFFINVRELLKISSNKSDLGWKTIELLKLVSLDPLLCKFLQDLEIVPVLACYLNGPNAASPPSNDKSASILTVLKCLTRGLAVQRSGLWLQNLLKNLTDRILDRADENLQDLLAIACNLALDSEVVVSELQRNRRCEELLKHLSNFDGVGTVIQLDAAQVIQFFKLCCIVD